jgi:type IV secretory pathway VirB10-like protein
VTEDFTPDNRLLSSDLDGSTSNRATNTLKEKARTSGARLSKRFKAASVILMGAVAVAILIGVLTSGQAPVKNAADRSDIEGVGQTDPDVNQLEMQARTRAEDNRARLLRASVSPARSSPTAVVPLPVANASQAQTKTPEESFREWQTALYYKNNQKDITSSMSAQEANIGSGGYTGATAGEAAGSSLGKPGQSAEREGLDNTLSSLRKALNAGNAQGGTSANNGNALAAISNALRGLSGGSDEVVAATKPDNLGFAAQGDAEKNGYLQESVAPPRSKRELFAGSIIPAVSLTAINSDLPGGITAMVRQTVYDSRDEHVILIPQGSKVIGQYNSDVGYGQSRVMVVWNRLIYPDGKQLNIEGMIGASGDGTSGLSDEVDNHYARIFGSAFLVSLLGVSAQLSQPQNSSLLSAPSAGSQAAAAAASQLNSVGTSLLNKNLSIAPTLSIRPGFSFNIMVNKTMILPQYNG